MGPDKKEKKKISASSKVVRVEATDLDDRGAGVARLPRPNDERGERPPIALHVQGLLPGERADVQIEHRSPHGPRAFGRLARRYNAAPDRVVPGCSAYGRCGGCALQHLGYEAQLRWKAERLQGALRAAGLDVDVSGCVPSDNEGYGGRGRAKLVATTAPGASGPRVILGAFAPRSHDVVDLSGCRVVTSLLQRVVAAVAGAATACALTTYDEPSGRGALRYVLLRDTSDGQVQVSLVVAEPPPDPQLEAFVGAIAAAEPRVVSVTLHENRDPGNALLQRQDPELPAGDGANGADRVLRGEAPLWERLRVGAGEIALRVSPRSFLQVNRAVAARIYGDVVAGLAPRPDDRLLDLYCGVLGIGLAAAAAAPGLSILGIEESPSAIEDAEAGARRAGARAALRRGDAARALEALGAAGEAPTLCALNPPRRGCDAAVLDRIIELGPRAIAYVSCDPDTLARDLGRLRARYHLRGATAYDMHPHTAHVEALVLLERR